MIPGVSTLFGGSGGFSGSSSAANDTQTGPVGFGGFNFQPKGGSLPNVAWIAIAGVVAVLLLARKR